MSDKPVVDLAIIIPTLNEEHFVGRLLDSIARQKVVPKELVVVDAYSKDQTLQEIKKRQKKLTNLRYFQIPRQTISRQRNFGAKKTASPHILFLDADMELKKEDVLEKYYAEVLKRKPDAAAAFNLPLSNYWKDRMFFQLMNTIFKLIKPIWPMTTGMNLFLTRQAFEKLRGFDESIRVGEDMDLVQRTAKAKMKFIFLKSINIYTSARRYAKEGRRRFVFKVIKSSYNVLRYGHKENPMEYEFGHFTKNT